MTYSVEWDVKPLLTHSRYVVALINLNSILIKSGSIKILCVIIKLKFTEPEAGVYIRAFQFAIRFVVRIYSNRFVL